HWVKLCIDRLLGSLQRIRKLEGGARDGSLNIHPSQLATTMDESTCPVRLRILKGRSRGWRWVDADNAPILPLQGKCRHVGALTHAVELNGTLNTIKLAGIKRLDQLGVISALALFDCLLQHLADRECLGGVRRDIVGLAAI